MAVGFLVGWPSTGRRLVVGWLLAGGPFVCRQSHARLSPVGHQLVASRSSLCQRNCSQCVAIHCLLWLLSGDFFVELTSSRGSAPDSDCQWAAGAWGGAAAPQGKYFRTRCGFCNGAFPWSDLASSLSRRDRQPVASWPTTSQPISQSDYRRPLVSNLSASRQTSRHADNQASSQSSQ